MTTRGKRDFPFRKEAKPVINEDIHFDDIDTSIGKRKTDSGKTATTRRNHGDNYAETKRNRGSTTTKTVTSGQSLLPAENPNSKSNHRDSRATSKAGPASGRKRKVESDDSDDTQDQQGATATAPASGKKRPRISAAAETATTMEAANGASQKHTAHYPVSSYTVPPLAKAEAARSHKETLISSMEAICAAEIDTLENYFETELQGATHEKILAHLSEVIAGVVEEVRAQCPSDAVFQPEVTKIERTKLDANRKKLDQLNTSIEKLRHYAENTEDFMKEIGLIEPKSPGVGNKSGKKPPSAKANKKVNGLAADFEEKLNHMDALMDQILRATDSASLVSRAARDSQQKLFDSHQKARRYDAFAGLDGISSGSSGDSGPPRTRGASAADMDPKQLLKTMQQRY